MSELLCIDINTLDDFLFQFYQTGLVNKVLEAAGVDNFNVLLTTTKGEVTLGKDENDPDANRYWPNSYAYILGIIFYLKSNTRPYTYFTIHRRLLFTHTTKSSHDMDVKIACLYLQGTKDKFLLFITSKEIMVNCCVDADYSGL